MAQHDQYNILNNISDSVLIIDQDYTIVFANQHFGELCDIAAEKLVGEKCYHIHHHSPFPCAGKSVPEKQCVHKQVFETGLPVSVDHHHIMPNGSKKLLQISASPIKDVNGAVVRFITIIKDFTKKEELRKAFDEALVEHKAILNNAPFSVSYLDCDMRVIKLNSRMEQLVGHKSDEVKGWHCYDVWGQYAQDDTKKGRERICDACKVQSALADGQTYAYERKFGDRYIEITVSPVKDKNGKIIGALEYGQDISERKAAENALQKSEQRFRLLYERAPLPYQSLDKNGCFLDMNQTWLDTLGGYIREEVIGKSFIDFLCPASRELFKNNFFYFKEAGEADSVEFEMVKKDGSVIVVLFNGKIVYDEAGNVKQTHCIFQDITAQRQADDDLKKQKILLETIINTMPDIICLKDGKGRWLLANEYDLDLFKLQDVQYQGKTDAELAPYSEFYRDSFLTCMDTDNEAWAQKKPSRDEEIIPRPDGTSCVFDIVKIPLFNADGSRHALVVAGRDITALKQSETLLRQSKEEWERTFNAMSDIITIQDKNMEIVRANKAAYDFFKAAPGDLIGKKCFKVFRDSSNPCSGCPELKTLETIRCHSEIIQHKKLEKIFHVSSAPILDENNEIEFLVHIAKDITEQKRLEEELFQAHKMEAIGTLAGGIAHDFNNILSAIIGFTELAKGDLEDGSRAAGDLAEVLQASQRATGLVRQILTFSRKGPHKREKLQPYLIAKEALKLMRASLPTTIEILENIDSESDAILADPTKIHQIIVNLCTNALQAMEEETGTLIVTLVRRELSANDVLGHPGVSPGPFIELSVSDTGCGMDKQTQQRIFEPYFTTKPTGKGTGLGLAVVLGIVQDYKGMITVDSEPGKGSTFHIYFPAVLEKAKKTEKTEVERPLPTGTERILTVDDESTIVALQKAVLSRLGYTVTTKTSSEEALATFKQDPNRFDLLITDQTMPALSGAKFAQEVLSIRPDMSIILCTGYSSTLSEEKAMEIGIKKYLTKPVNSKDLARTVRSVLDKN